MSVPVGGALVPQGEGADGTGIQGTGWQTFLILATAAYSPLTVWANAGDPPNLDTLFFTFLMLAAFGLLTWRILILFRLDSVGAAYAVVFFLYLITNTGALVGGYPAVGRVAFIGAAAVVGAIAFWLRRMKLFQVAMVWLPMFLILYPLLTGVSHLVGSSRPSPLGTPGVNVSQFEEKPDVVLLIVDGYGALEVLDEFYGYDNSEILQQLRTLGFEAPGSIRSNYPRTSLSVPSVLSMGYLATGDLSKENLLQLNDIVSGDNRLSDLFSVNGYRTVYVESGWLGSECGATIDVCVPSRWPDESFFDVADRTVLRGVPGFEEARPFTEGALHVSSWLSSDIDQYLEDDRPDYIFVHLLLPHPPLFVDEECVPHWRDGLGGFAVVYPWFTAERQARSKTAYIDQVQCVNRVILDLAQEVAKTGNVALIMGDHGPDSQAQLFYVSPAWTESQIRERFGAFFVARYDGCDMTDLGSLVNVGRRLVGCLSGDEVPDLATQIFDVDKTDKRNVIREMTAPSG